MVVYCHNKYVKLLLFFLSKNQTCLNYPFLSFFSSSYNVWKHMQYPALISRQPVVITQFR